mgnify:FL=1
MTTIVRRKALGISSVKGIVQASTTGIGYANNYQGIPDDNVYIRWGCTSSVPNRNAHVINSAASIHRVSDKSGFRRDMMVEGLCPKTWWSFNDTPLFLPEDEPLIVRTKTHAQGRGMWVCFNEATLSQAVDQAGPGFYINRYIPKVAEFRVFVHQGRVVWVAQKTPANPNDVAWNVAKGGRFDNVGWGDWNMAVVNNALSVWELTKTHFAGIDVMLSADGTATCVEANSAPSQTSPYRQSCVAKAFDWMATAGHERRLFPPVIAGAWRDAIHPAIWSRN